MSKLSNKHVASGSFEVFKSRQQVLEAFLGTCVGVGIVDKKAGVGGLYHILLPEHTAENEPLSNETYANTGMPLFLQALRDAGSDPVTMEATIAGGALMGTISRLDLQLDLGGRAVEIVHQMLKEAGIPVVQSLTGGYFGTKLSLDLLTLKCQIEPAYLELLTDSAQIYRPTPQELDCAIANIQPIPQVALKIIRTMQTEDYGLGDIAREIRHDQVISAHVIRMCNSAYVSPQIEIESIDHAILILGARLVFQFVLSSMMSNFFEGSNRGYSMSKGGLYHHAVSTAIVAEQISRLTRHAEPDTAYTAGLLHDIGKVLLDQFVASARPLFYGKIVSAGEHLLDIEKSELGITHVEAGVRLAKLWDFPSSLCDAIAYHDQPELAENDRDLAHVIHLADLLMSRFNTGYELDGINTEGLPARLDFLGLNSSSLSDLIAQLPWKTLDTPGYF